MNRVGDPETDTHGRLRDLEKGMADATFDVRSLADWRTCSVDPTLKQFHKILIEGDGPENPSLVTLVALILQKFDLILDTVKWTGKSLVALAALIVALITINSIWGPVIRQYFGS